MPASECLLLPLLIDRIALFSASSNAHDKPIYLGIGTEFGSEWPSEMMKLVELDAATWSSRAIPARFPSFFPCLRPRPGTRDKFQRAGPWTDAAFPQFQRGLPRCKMTFSKARKEWQRLFIALVVLKFVDANVFSVGSNR